jgi:hypothetical protein
MAEPEILALALGEKRLTWCANGPRLPYVSPYDWSAEATNKALFRLSSHSGVSDQIGIRPGSKCGTLNRRDHTLQMTGLPIQSHMPSSPRIMIRILAALGGAGNIEVQIDSLFAPRTT